MWKEVCTYIWPYAAQLQSTGEWCWHSHWSLRDHAHSKELFNVVTLNKNTHTHICIWFWACLTSYHVPQLKPWQILRIDKYIPIIYIACFNSTSNVLHRLRFKLFALYPLIINTRQFQIICLSRERELDLKHCLQTIL